MHRIIIFDDGCGHLSLMTDLRASFEVRTGMLTTAGRIAAVFPKRVVGYWVPEPIRELVASRADAPVNRLPEEEEVLCINGRWALPHGELHIDHGEAVTETGTGHVVAALLRRADADYFLTTGQLHERVRERALDERVLYRYPWDVIGSAKDAITLDTSLVRLDDAKVTGHEAEVVGDHPSEVDRDAKIFPGVVFDLTEGPITVHANATIRPGAVLCGPCSIGPNSTVMDHAVIRGGTAIGQHCKVGGEVANSILQGYANKAHDGYLGDSWVGKWVNLGAGTTVSNLLNTYEPVSMRLEPGGPRQRTGLRFLGTIFGDHVKTAILTRFMTGSVVGTGAMIATTAAPPTTIPRFAWLTDKSAASYKLDKFIDVMTTVMARRGKTPAEPYLELLRDVFARAVEPVA